MRRYHRTRFFRLDWKPGIEQGKQVIGGLEIEVLSMPACIIWGYETDSEDDSDHNLIDEAKERGQVFGKWFSVNCADGERGVNFVSGWNAQQITEEEFEAARARGWTDVLDDYPA